MHMFEWIVTAISLSGYAGVVILMAIESACIPLPSEIIMPFAGYLAFTGRFDLIVAATAGAIGCSLGSGLAWWVGMHGGRTAVERWGRYILISRTELVQADRFFARYGILAVFAARLLPIVRTFISLPAGIARMPFTKFQIYTFIGSWPWCFGLAYLGFVLGKAWNHDPRVHQFFHRFDLVVAATLVLGFVWYVAHKWRARV